VHICKYTCILYAIYTYICVFIYYIYISHMCIYIPIYSKNIWSVCPLILHQVQCFVVFLKITKYSYRIHIEPWNTSHTYKIHIHTRYVLCIYIYRCIYTHMYRCIDICIYRYVYTHIYCTRNQPQGPEQARQHSPTELHFNPVFC
jgi:hypothetical protein